MFTGLIETTAKVIEFTRTSEGGILKTECPFGTEIKIGDSISVNGVCLTVIKIDNKTFSFDVSKETLNISALSALKVGQTVNIERAMKVSSRFDGHIITGHIDGTADIAKISDDGFSFRFEFNTPKEILKYIVKKGSVGINGISLTVADITESKFWVEVIPHTIKQTNLSLSKVGDKVNIETDILARYVEKFLSLNKNNSKISMEMLKENGYL